MDEIEPPKPRANLGRKRGVKQEPKILSVKVKARITANKVIKTQDEKIKKATHQLHTARAKKERILKTDNALKGKDSTVLTADGIENLAPNVQEHVKENVIFEPNQLATSL